MEYDYLDLDFLFRTIYGEARGEPVLGQIAVGFVVCNRAKIAKEYKKLHDKNHPLYGSGTPASACTVAYQFSCWNLGDPNLPIIQALDPTTAEGMAFVEAAKTALEEKILDPSNGATHYHTPDVFPDWAQDQKSCAAIGRHIFYNLG